jgi:hypothetical protein
MNPTRVVIKGSAEGCSTRSHHGKTYLRGRTLASYLDDFGGFEGEVTQPMTGRRFAVSLEQWRGCDPQSTWLDVSFVTDL